jgi:hypothetical protein
MNIVLGVGKCYEKLDFGDYVLFYQTMKHDEIYVLKLPRVFLVIITESFLRQHPEIVRSYELQSKKGVT